MNSYLLHGDQTSDGQFYCVRCDMSFEPTHFIDGKVHSDGLLVQCEKYRTSKRIFRERRALAKSRGVRPEPVNATPNLFTGVSK